MRSSLLLITAALLVPGLASAQTHSWGAAAGMVNSGVSGQMERFQERTVGTAFGLYTTRPIRDRVSLGIELWYSRTGVDFSLPFRGGSIPGPQHYSLRFQALELHALPKVEVPSPFSWIRPTLMAGPALVWIPSCRYRQSYTNERAEAGRWTSCETDPDYLTPGSPGGAQPQPFLALFERRSLDVRAVAGIGLELPLGRSVISVEGRYTYGLRAMDGGGNPYDRHEGFWGLARVGWTP